MGADVEIGWAWYDADYFRTEVHIHTEVAGPAHQSFHQVRIESIQRPASAV
jgi:hypothetical protein